ncbi:MAG: nucleoside triphosphate pyrophosphohydrolase [Treponemataceae bacterium]
MNTKEKTENVFLELLDIIRTLRAPDGCPWDIEQTPYTMREPLIEEAFEVIDAINESDVAHIQEELGDLLFNVLMISYMFEQAGRFSIADVLSETKNKIVRRHPHVFGKTEGFAGPKADGCAKNSEEVLMQWYEIKQVVEQRNKGGILSTVPKSFPPLLKAYKMQKKMSKVGFDFPTISEARQKVSEELLELDAELKTQNIENISCKDKALKSLPENAKEKIEGELGDVLFSLVNLARLLNINPELALNRTNTKFAIRVQYIEKKMQAENLELSAENLKTMEKFWEESKKNKV